MLGVICQDDNHLSFKTMKTFQFIDAWNKVGQSSSVSTYTLICLSSAFLQSTFSSVSHIFPWTTSDPTFEKIINAKSLIRMIMSWLHVGCFWSIQNIFLITPYQIFSSRWKPDVNLINIFCHNWKADVFRRSCFKPHDRELAVTYYRMIAVVWVFVISLKMAYWKIWISI